MTLFPCKSVIVAWESVIVRKVLYSIPNVSAVEPFINCRYMILDFFEINNLSDVTNL